MTEFEDILASMAVSQNTIHAPIPEGWGQGRTAYGGLVAALALEAAERAVPGLPPLRSALIAFVGPAKEAAEMSVRVLRQGRSVSFVEVETASAGGVAAKCVFSFGAARPSKFAFAALRAPDVPSPAASGTFVAPEHAPAFVRHFEMRLARGAGPVSGAAEADNLVWARFRNPREGTGLVHLLALADVLPPAVMSMFDAPAPVSSVTWMVNVLADPPVTEDGWWLLSASAENAAAGYSSQNMLAWNRAGVPVLAARQSVAVFA